MTGMTMVQWADLTGRGFSPHEVGPAADRGYWTAAERLLEADLSQPPEGIRSTAGHPIWTLRRVRVHGAWLWCFVVQGRRGPFGVAGTCRFAFAAEGMSALDAWTAGRAIAADDHPLPVCPADTEQFTRALLQVLGGVVVGQAAIPVATEPAGAAAVITAVLKVLPEHELRSWSWSTCMLQRPDSPELKVVSGAWPAEFRDSEPHRAESIDQWFRRGPVTEDEIKTHLVRKEVHRGFEELVHHARYGIRPDPELLHGEHTLEQMLVELGHANHVPEWTDVPDMLDSPAGSRRLADGHLQLVRQWAAKDPWSAVARLRAGIGAPLAGALLASVIEAQNGTVENILELPTEARPELTDWHRQLAAVLVHCYPDPKALRAVTSQWISHPGVLSSDRDRVAARDWLRRLGLTPQTDPGHFPPNAKVVIAEINKHQALTPRAAGEVALARRPLFFLESLVVYLVPLSGEAVGEMLWLCAMRTRGPLPDAEQRHLHPLAQALTRAGLRGHADEQWVHTMLDTIDRRIGGRQSSRLRRIMYGALDALLDLDPEAPTSTLLSRRCLTIGYDPHAEPRDPHATPRVAEALRFAHSRTTARPARTRPGAGDHPISRPRARKFAVYLTALLLTAGVLLATTVLVFLRDRTAPPVAVPSLPAAPAPAGEFTIVLAPRPADPARDSTDFRAQFAAKIGKEAPVFIRLISYGPPTTRADKLEEALRDPKDPRFKGVQFSSLNQPVAPPDGTPAGSLIGTVFVRR